MFKTLKQASLRRREKRGPFGRKRFFEIQKVGPLSQANPDGVLVNELAEIIFGKPIPASKASIIANLSGEGTTKLKEMIESSLTAAYTIPSKASPIPAFVPPKFADFAASGIVQGDILAYNKPFHLAYKWSNFISDAHTPADGAELSDFGFELKLRRLAKSDSQAAEIAERSVKPSEMSAFGLPTNDAVKEIFEEMTPYAVCKLTAMLVRLWSAYPLRTPDDGGLLNDFEITTEQYEQWCLTHMASLEEMQELPLGIQYGHAISAGISLGFSSGVTPLAKSSPSLYILRLYSYFVGDTLNARGLTLAEYLKSGAEDLDEFIFSPEAFDWLFDKLSTGEVSAVFDWSGYNAPGGSPEIFANLRKQYQDIQDELKLLIHCVRALTDLVDRLWKDAYESNPTAALLGRFGHPTMINTSNLTAADWIPGGQIMQSSYVAKSSGQFRFNACLPIDKSGRPYKSYNWGTFVSVCGYEATPASVSGLGDLARACSLSYDAWHIDRNFGLRKDSLYTLAFISSVPSIHKTGASPDDATGIIRGGQHESLKDAEIGTGHNSFYYPTLRGKVTAVHDGAAELLAQVSVAGGISTDEIDLNNWRLSRLSDLRGVPGEHTDVKTHSGEVLSRSAAQLYAENLRSKTVNDGVLSYEQLYKFSRPVLPYGRADALAMYFTNPGRYLRLTGKGLDINELNDISVSGGVIKSVYRKVAFGNFLHTEYEDVATGEMNGFRYVANGVPGVASRNPETFLRGGSTVISPNLSREDANDVYGGGFVLKKNTHTSPGRLATPIPAFLLMSKEENKHWFKMRVGSIDSAERLIAEQTSGKSVGKAAKAPRLEHTADELEALAPAAGLDPVFAYSAIASMIAGPEDQQEHYNFLMGRAQFLTKEFAKLVYSSHKNYQEIVDEYLTVGDMMITGTTGDFLYPTKESIKYKSTLRAMRDTINDFYLGVSPHGGLYLASGDNHLFSNRLGWIFAAPGYGPTGHESVGIRLDPDLLAGGATVSKDQFYVKDLMLSKAIKEGITTLGVDGFPEVPQTLVDFLMYCERRYTEKGSMTNDKISGSLVPIQLPPTTIKDTFFFIDGKAQNNTRAAEPMYAVNMLQRIYMEGGSRPYVPSLVDSVGADSVSAHLDPKYKNTNKHEYWVNALKWIEATAGANRFSSKKTARFQWSA